MTVDETTILTFFFAVFWSAAISSMRTLHVFHVWDYYSHSEGKYRGCKTILRSLYGILVLNALPLLLFFAAQWAVSNKTLKFLACGIASLSVFSIVYALPILPQSCKRARGLWPDINGRRWKCIAADADMPEDKVWVSVVASACYIIFPLAAAWLLP